MRILTTSRQLETAFSRLLNKYQHVSFAVAWASCGFALYDQLVVHRSKIQLAVVGTHFYQTHPKFIARFRKDKRVRFVKQPDGIFHPKLYLFENSAQDWSCILGSPNFTNAAFTSNSEAAALFNASDDKDGTTRVNLVKALHEYWKIGEAFEQQQLEYYTLLWRRFQHSGKVMTGKFGEERNAKPLLSTPLLQMTWSKYFSNVLNDSQHGIDGRIEVLDAARRLFKRHPHFATMSKEERQAIAGFGRETNVPWSWFGSMRGAGVFKNRVNANDVNLSHALDAIPLNGSISRENYVEFINSYKKAFPYGRRHGLGTATRLLAMKRPDYFVCFDAANRRGLCKAFGIKLAEHDYGGYWDSIVERILISQWWSSPRPKGPKETKVWSGRAAFLDSLYYKPRKR